MSIPEAAAGGSRGRGALPAVLLLAFAVRLGWILAARLDPSDGEYFDMAWYHITAQQIAAGHGVVRLDGTPTAVWPPLYPALVAPLYLLFGPSLWVGKLLNPFLGVATTFFVYDIGRRLASRRAGLVAATIFALCPDAIFFHNFVMSEVAFVAFLTGAVWLFIVLEGRGAQQPLVAWLGLGAVVALATLVRGIALLWWSVPALAWLISTRSPRATAPRTAAVALACALTIAPWTLRNAIQMGEPILVATSLGRTLAHAHSPFETGGPSLKTFVYRQQIQKRFEHLPQPQMEVELNRAYTRLSLEYMLTHPGHELRILPNRVRHLFLNGHVGLDIGRPKIGPGELEPIFGPRRRAVIAAVADAQFYALLLLGVLGLPRFCRRDDPAALAVPLTLGYFAFFHLVLFPADPRFHLPMLPLLAVSAGALIQGRWDSARAKSLSIREDSMRSKPMPGSSFT